jgi:putative glutamine amidotransferase
VILVSTSYEEKAAPYVQALKAAGVPAERIQVVTPTSEPAPISGVSGATGLVLCGGVDVVPGRYGEETLPWAGVEAAPERDEMEWALLDAARAARTPTWCVCRGLQVLNVYLGGSLWQDLPTQRPGAVDHSVSDTPDVLAHTVRVTAPDAPLGERLTRDVPLVNSRHHQAIKRIAPGLLPVAESPDGLVEAAVLEDSAWWVRGVQWHPENLIALDQQRALWIDFSQAVARAVGLP